jgi:hypothetical protein
MARPSWRAESAAVVIDVQPRKLALCPHMIIGANVLRSIKASQAHLDPVVEDRFMHRKGAAATVTEAALGLGGGAIARWFALNPRECADWEMNVGEEDRARSSTAHPQWQLTARMGSAVAR